MQEKKELDDHFNDALGDCRKLGFVTDLFFAKVQENAAILSSEDPVNEPVMPTNFYISYQSVEANRIEACDLISEILFIYFTISFIIGIPQFKKWIFGLQPGR